jgi:hypothetical protein
MNKLDEKVMALKEELEQIQLQSEVNTRERVEIEIEKSKIVEQNTNIKDRIAELIRFEKEVSAKDGQLKKREEQIIAREKLNLLIDKKIEDLQTRTADIILREKKNTLKEATNAKDKQIIDNKMEIYNKISGADKEAQARIKLKEGEIDKELERLKKLSL